MRSANPLVPGGGRTLWIASKGFRLRFHSPFQDFSCRKGDLTKHRIITTPHSGVDSWSFPPLSGSSVPRTVQFTPRLVLNSDRGAVASAVDGHGVTRMFSCQVAEHVREGALEIVLADDEEPPLPVHVISPNGRLSVPKVRAFVDFAVPRLRSRFARPAKDVSDRESATRSQRGRVSAG